MAKKPSVMFSCIECGYQTTQWLGKCPDCGQWNTLVEEAKFSAKNAPAPRSDGGEVPRKISEIELIKHDRVLSGIGEFDRVMGGGVVPGSLVLIGGEPGIGKSTLLTSVMGNFAKNDKVLYVSGEESVAQIAGRAKRLGIANDNMLLFNETNWLHIKEQIKKTRPKFVVLDSIQTTTSPEIQSPPGSVSQIREVTYELMNHVKANGLTCFVIGHITKEGTIAGPKILEHMVDTVVYFEGDQFGHYRMLRSMKNRFGNANEVGIFEMRESGLEEVKNPSQYFLDDHLDETFGRSLSCVIEGSRTLFVEIQALVVENKFGNGRRTTQGLDNNRLAMLVAVIDKYLEIPISYNDIYVNVIGGIKLQTRETDLSIIASLLSSYKGKVLEKGLVFLGEVGLTGEVRSVPMIEMRLKEMAQLNYKKVVTSEQTAKKYQGKFPVKLIGVRSVNQLQQFL